MLCFFLWLSHTAQQARVFTRNAFPQEQLGTETDSGWNRGKPVHCSSSWEASLLRVQSRRFPFLFFWSIVYLKYSVSFPYTAKWQYFRLENPYRQRSLAGCSPWGGKEANTTERLSTAQHNIHISFFHLLFHYGLLKYIEYSILLCAIQ